MNTPLGWRTFSLCLAAVALALAYGLGIAWVWTPVFIVLGLLGWWAPAVLKLQPATALFIVFIAAAALGCILGLPTAAMLLAVLAALAYWDLDALHLRLSEVSDSPATRRLAAGHLKRLLAVLGLSLAAGLGAIFIHINLTLGWAMILGLVVIAGIRLGIGALNDNVE